jgi:hypothetical protein
LFFDQFGAGVAQEALGLAQVPEAGGALDVGKMRFWAAGVCIVLLVSAVDPTFTEHGSKPNDADLDIAARICLYFRTHEVV